MSDPGLTELGGVDAREAFGGSEWNLLVVDVDLEAFGPVAYFESIEDPVDGAAGGDSDAVDALGVAVDEWGELHRFFDRSEVCAGDVFRELDEVCVG